MCSGSLLVGFVPWFALQYIEWTRDNSVGYLDYLRLPSLSCMHSYLHACMLSRAVGLPWRYATHWARIGKSRLATCQASARRWRPLRKTSPWVFTSASLPLDYSVVTNSKKHNQFDEGACMGKWGGEAAVHAAQFTPEARP